MTRKLSKAQQAVLDAMKDGWTLNRMNDIDGYTWLSKDGHTKLVSIATVHALLKQQYIEETRSFPVCRLVLAPEACGPCKTCKNASEYPACLTPEGKCPIVSYVS